MMKIIYRYQISCLNQNYCCKDLIFSQNNTFTSMELPQTHRYLLTISLNLAISSNITNNRVCSLVIAYQLLLGSSYK